MALALTLTAGFALTSGLARDIVAFVAPPTQMTVLPPPPAQDRKPVEIVDTEIVRIDLTRVIVPEMPRFLADPATTITVEPARDEPAPGPTTFSRPAPLIEPKRTAPRLRPGPAPDYPAASIRGNEEGATLLEVCVAANGRVTSASVAQSSGHVRLDDAALKWVRNSRFTAGTVGGAEQAMCGHPVVYEWKLQTVRR